jgi:hypothetical protein
MSLLQSTLLGFIDERLQSLLRVPEMWGSDESVELQFLQLLEIRLLTLSPNSRSQVARIQREYIRYVQAKFPDEPPEALAAILARLGRRTELPELLREFFEAEKQRTQEMLERFPSGQRLLDDSPGKNRPPRHYVS